MADIEEHVKLEAIELRKKIAIEREKYKDKSFSELNKNVEPIRMSIKSRSYYRGHLDKINGLDIYGDKDLITASQDGKILAWNISNTNKTHVFSLDSVWVLCCAFSTNGNLIAAGGLDNSISFFTMNNNSKKPDKNDYHNGYVSSIKFINDDTWASTSGDGSCCIFKITHSEPITIFKSNSGDVNYVDFEKSQKNLISTCSCDGTIKIYDLRLNKPILFFDDHKKDVNRIEFHPNGTCIGSTSDDNTSKLFDLRSSQLLCELAAFQDFIPQSISFSKSGRAAFVTVDRVVTVHDVLLQTPIAEMVDHEALITCGKINSSGGLYITSSWDTLAKSWF